jgi:hypothetical protein
VRGDEVVPAVGVEDGAVDRGVERAELGDRGLVTLSRRCSRRWPLCGIADRKRLCSKRGARPRLFQSPFRAGIQILTYQLEPLRKALQLPRVNLFIADDVGLGKTIEAGLIARELLLRRKVDTIVVVCPPSVLLQWHDELETRFGLTFAILDRDYIARIRCAAAFRAWGSRPRGRAGLPSGGAPTRGWGSMSIQNTGKGLWPAPGTHDRVTDGKADVARSTSVPCGAAPLSSCLRAR